MGNLREIISAGTMDFEGIQNPYFLLGLLSAFDNRYQAKADNFFEEISWKQFFAIIWRFASSALKYFSFTSKTAA